ncbi:MAG: hypothetical protein AAGA55_01740 [Planctomycetota bacterium]
MNNRLLLAAIASLSAPAQAGGNPTLILDDFDANPNDDAGGPRQIMVTSDAPGPFGGDARFELVTDSMFEGDTGSVVYASDPGITGRGTITWNNDGAGLGLDAVALGVVGFEIDFVAVDQEFPMRLTLRSSNGGGANTEIRIDPSLISDGIQTVSLSLDNLNAFLDFDPTDLDAIELDFNFRSDTTEGLDFVLTQFRAVVPSPGSAALFGIAGVACLRRRR